MSQLLPDSRLAGARLHAGCPCRVYIFHAPSKRLAGRQVSTALADSSTDDPSLTAWFKTRMLPVPRFQDGAATANNPAALALAEARALWPDTPVDVLVSLGSGATPPARRERSLSTYLETGR